MALKLKSGKKPTPSENGDLGWFKNHLKEPKTFMPTGFRQLDTYIDGLYPGSIHIVAGRPGMGKTTLDMNLILAMSDKKHLVYPTENSRARYTEMMLSHLSGIEDKEIRQNSHNIMDKLEPHLATLADRKVKVMDGYKPSIGDIRRAIEDYMPDVLHFDYFQNIYVDPMRAGYREFTAKVEQFHQLAIDYKIPLVLLSQLKRPPSDREGGRPQLSDLKETGKLEEAAKLALLVFKNGPVMEVIVEKNRDGATGIVEFTGEWDTHRLMESA